MNALQLQNAVSHFAKENSLSFKEALQRLKAVNNAIKLVNIRSSLIKSITLETSANWPSISISLTVKEFLSVVKGIDSEFEKANCLHIDAEIKQLKIEFLDNSSRTYKSSSTSSFNLPSEEVCANINFLVKSKFDTAW